MAHLPLRSIGKRASFGKLTTSYVIYACNEHAHSFIWSYVGWFMRKKDWQQHHTNFLSSVVVLQVLFSLSPSSSLALLGLHLALCCLYCWLVVCLCCRSLFCSQDRRCAVVVIVIFVVVVVVVGVGVFSTLPKCDADSKIILTGLHSRSGMLLIFIP